MYKQNQILVDLLEPVISTMGYEMLGIEQSGSEVRVYIDSASGITLDDCSQVSQQITGVLDVNDPIQGSYRLEVSSPGLDRPLFTVEQFKRFIGYHVRMRLHGKISDRKNFTGEINTVQQNTITILDDEDEYSIPADMIEKASLVVKTSIDTNSKD